MKFKKSHPETLQCTTSAARPFGCMELWAGNEKAHRSLELAGLEADVIAVPSGAESGGDLSAVFSCSDNVARVVLDQPVFAVMAVLGIVLMLLFRPRKPLIGYSRD